MEPPFEFGGLLIWNGFEFAFGFVSNGFRFEFAFGFVSNGFGFEFGTNGFSPLGSKGFTGVGLP